MYTSSAASKFGNQQLSGASFLDVNMRVFRMFDGAHTEIQRTRISAPAGDWTPSTFVDMCVQVNMTMIMCVNFLVYTPYLITPEGPIYINGYITGNP